MLGLTELDLKISDRLYNLRAALASTGIPVRTLPQVAGVYTVDEPSAIRTVIPEVKGEPSTTDGIQTITYTVVIAITLPKRYATEENIEKDVVEWVADETVKLLFNFLPWEASEYDFLQRPLSFIDYTLFRPEGGQWEAELVFQCSRQMRASGFEKPTFDYDEMVINLYAVLDKNMTSPTLVEQLKND